jgi:calcium/calmodulin-dependent protein kinase I
LLNPDPARRLTAEQALAHTWLTSFATPTEHDLSGLRENFDPRARWRSAISAARALSRIANHDGANRHNDRLAMSSDEEDEGGPTSWRGTPGSDTKRQPQSQQQQQQQQQQHLSPPSPDDRAPRRGLAGLARTGASPSSSSSPMSFSEAINKAKTSAEAEKNGDTPRAQANPTAFEPRKMEEVELRIPGSFSFENVGGGAAQAAGDAGTADAIDAVGLLGNLWRRMQLR